MSLRKKEVNILFTSVGRRVELLRAFRMAYRDLNFTGKLIGTDIDPLAPALQELDTYYLIPRTHDPHFIPALVDICQRERVDLVFPLIDPDIPVLAQNKQVLERTGVRVVVLDAPFAEMTADKWQTYRFLEELGVITPHSWLPEELPSAQFMYPLFIKPRHGSAAKNTFPVRNERELIFFFEYIEEPIIQEYIDGPEITSDVLCDFDGNVLSVVSRQRIEVRWGEVAKGVTIFNSDIAEQCVRIAKAMKATGPITVQCIMKNGSPVFTEINARYGGGAPLGITAGVPSPQWYLQLAAGMQVFPPSLGSYQTGLYISRYDQSYFLGEEDLTNAQSHRV